MSFLDSDTMSEMLQSYLDLQDQMMNTEVAITYQTNENMTYDTTNQTTTGTPTLHEITTTCIANEYRGLGEIESSQIVAAGLPLGKYKIHLRYDDRIILGNTYIPNTLKFTLRPNSEQPIVLTVNYKLSRIQYLMDDELYPYGQMHIGSIITE